MQRLLVGFLLFGLLPPISAAQTLEQRVMAVASGLVRFSFPARAGVCGNLGNQSSEDADGWVAGCEWQSVRIALRVENHRVARIGTHIGGEWRPSASVTDLGMVSPRDAAAYFIRLAQRDYDLDGSPILPATLADSVTIWPDLARLARNPTIRPERRREAVFWLGQAAGAAAAQALDSIATDPHGDREIRKQAVFALSQRTANQGVPALIRIARTNPDPELRKSALFWLGQSEDPRAVDLFEEILR
jgi:hypothetical protein